MRAVLRCLHVEFSFFSFPRSHARRHTQVYSRPSLDMDVGMTAYVEIALVPTGSVGMQYKARCASNRDQRLAYTGRSASCTAFPRGAWERVKVRAWRKITEFIA